MHQVDIVTTVSAWHAKQVQEVWNINPAVIRVVPNGVDPALYHTADFDTLRMAYTEDGSTGRDDHNVYVPQARFTLLYQSRPERGLLHLLRPEGIMAKLAEAKVPVHLVYCTYAAGTVPHMRGLYGQLDAWARLLPNVTNIGSLTKQQLADLQRQCDLLVYPTEFEEVSCITAMEAMHAGLPLLTTDSAALPETNFGAGAFGIPLIEGRVNELAFVEKITQLFTSGEEEYPAELRSAREAQFLAAQTRTWGAAVDALTAEIHKAFAARISPPAVMRHAIEHSDIQFAEWYWRTLPAPFKESPLMVAAKEEIDRLYAFRASPEAYVAHYAKHQSAYYDEFEDRVIGEDVTGTTRFAACALHLRKINSDRPGEGLRVLDYGCAHGHYLVPLAKLYPQWDFVGMDISDRAVKAALRWLERDKVENALVRLGAQADLTQETLGTFDVIYAGEVLEHVPDAVGLLNQFAKLLRPGGAIVVSTPTGRWEHSGTVPFRTGREHLHHLEWGDIKDICGSAPHEIVHAPVNSPDRSGFPLGSYVWCVWPEGKPLWHPNYQRKLAQYAPRQTVSVCMIVKDGERSLRRCVESFVDWVDEIIISIDPATTDRTIQACAQLALDYPNRPFVYGVAEKSAMKDGFDEARNESIDKASGDWILWVDSDEEIRKPWGLHPVLRPSQHNGYGFPQVHYAVDPAQVITTDFPCRVFRNHAGVRFYGVVHEHPEIELGKAVSWSLVRSDIQFLHHGYFDEETRRARFRRNYPLLLRDLEKFPEKRPLNKFLYLRDLAQNIVFESEKYGGQMTPQCLEQARKGVQVMEQIAEQPQLRMITDALQYYSHCVASSGMPSFEAEINVRTHKAEAPDMSAQLTFKGRFHSRDFYMRLVNRFAQESTKLYEDRHL